MIIAWLHQSTCGHNREPQWAVYDFDSRKQKLARNSGGYCDCHGYYEAIQVKNAKFVTGNRVGVDWKNLVVIGDEYLPYEGTLTEGYESLRYFDGRMYFDLDNVPVEAVSEILIIRGKAYAPRRNIVPLVVAS